MRLKTNLRNCTRNLAKNLVVEAAVRIRFQPVASGKPYDQDSTVEPPSCACNRKHNAEAVQCFCKATIPALRRYDLVPGLRSPSRLKDLFLSFYRSDTLRCFARVRTQLQIMSVPTRQPFNHTLFCIWVGKRSRKLNKVCSEPAQLRSLSDRTGQYRL